MYGVWEMKIRKAHISESDKVVNFVDSTFTVEGYGFVTSAQIKTEIGRGSVWIALDKTGIVGVRIGINRVYNLAVAKTHRRMGIGEQLINIHRPETIRVKAIPVGHLSKKQKDGFVSPEPFYKKIGFVFRCADYAKNFWQRGKDKAHFHRQGKIKHIKIYEDENPKQKQLWPNEANE